MNHWLLLNKKAGSLSVQQDWLLEQADEHELDVHEPTPAELPQLLQQAEDSGVQRLLIAGGDGSVAAVVETLAPDFDRFELGIIPMGTGNDFARSLGISPDDYQESFENALFGTARPIDLVAVHDEQVTYCLNAATGGAGGEVTAKMTGPEKQRWGAFAYWLRAIGQFVDLHPHELRLEADGEIVYDDEAYGIIVTNGRFVGGGFPIAPSARMDDGTFDVTVIPVLPRWDLISAGMFYAMGQRTMAPQIVTLTASALDVYAKPEMMFSLDGEPSVHLKARFEILPRVLQVVAGRLLK